MSNSKHIQVPSAEYGCAAASAFSDEDIVSSTVLSPAILSPAVSALSPRLSAFVLHWIYDYKNQLTSVTIKDGAGNTVSASAYLYDPSGARIYAKDVTYSGATVTSSLTTYYPTKNYSETWDNVANKKIKIDEHIYAGDLAVATVEYTPNASGTLTPKTYYNIVDQRGSAQVSTDSAGNVVELSDYYAYGNPKQVSTANTFQEQRKYIGQYHDVATSLEYLNARYYNSNYGRFATQDPLFWGGQNLLNPQSFNAYSYANDNPITGSDPLGLYDIKTGQIQRGDTLSAITNQINATYGTSYSVASLASANGISNPNKIYAGNYINMGLIGVSLSPSVSTVTAAYASSVSAPSTNVSLPTNSGGGVSYQQQKTSVTTGEALAYAAKQTAQLIPTSAGICGNVSAGMPGVYGSCTACVVVTQKDVGLTVSSGGGGSTAWQVGAGGQLMFSNAKSIDDMKGLNIAAGGSSTTPWGFNLGGDYSHATNSGGWAVSGGPSIGPRFTSIIPAEMHMGADYGWWTLKLSDW